MTLMDLRVIRLRDEEPWYITDLFALGVEWPYGYDGPCRWMNWICYPGCWMTLWIWWTLLVNEMDIAALGVEWRYGHVGPCLWLKWKCWPLVLNDVMGTLNWRYGYVEPWADDVDMFSGVYWQYGWVGRWCWQRLWICWCLVLTNLAEVLTGLM